MRFIIICLLMVMPVYADLIAEFEVVDNTLQSSTYKVVLENNNYIINDDYSITPTGSGLTIHATAHVSQEMSKGWTLSLMAVIPAESDSLLNIAFDDRTDITFGSGNILLDTMSQLTVVCDGYNSLSLYQNGVLVDTKVLNDVTYNNRVEFDICASMSNVSGIKLESGQHYPSVPEPTSASLVVLGLFLTVLKRKR